MSPTSSADTRHGTGSGSAARGFLGVADTEVVVLSLLAERPRHGYDLDRVIAQRGYRQWTALAFSSIYYVLQRLAGRGLIEPVTTAADRRTAFQLTDTGRRELRLTALGSTRSCLIRTDWDAAPDTHAARGHSPICPPLMPV